MVPRLLSTRAMDASEARAWPGEPYPLGATWDGKGTNFSLFSERAAKVELCLFDDHGRERRVVLPEVTAFCWHGYLPDVGPGQLYGFRVHGPWDPKQGLLFNPAKLLLDPYARAIAGDVRWDDALWASRMGSDGLERNDEDGAP